tara:strand:+ start:707 stop:1099 length:393 start_codon:yes stop_codon:yes gene_type:complete
MGIIKSKLSLFSTGSSTTTTGGFSISVADSLAIEAPVVNLASGNVTSSSGPDVIIGSGVSDVTYVYIKYKTAAAGSPVLVLSTVTGTQNFSDLTAGEAIFIPVKGGVGLRVTSSDTNAITYEYGYWTKNV